MMIFIFFIIYVGNKGQRDNLIKEATSHIIEVHLFTVGLNIFQAYGLSVMDKTKLTGAGSSERIRGIHAPFPLSSLTGDLFIFLPAERRVINGG